MLSGVANSGPWGTTMYVWTLSLLAAGIVLVVTSPAVAGEIIQVPGPGSLSLLAVGAAAVALGARWIRRR